MKSTLQSGTLTLCPGPRADRLTEQRAELEASGTFRGWGRVVCPRCSLPYSQHQNVAGLHTRPPSGSVHPPVVSVVATPTVRAPQSSSTSRLLETASTSNQTVNRTLAFSPSPAVVPAAIPLTNRLPIRPPLVSRVVVSNARSGSESALSVGVHSADTAPTSTLVSDAPPTSALSLSDTARPRLLVTASRINVEESRRKEEESSEDEEKYDSGSRRVVGSSVVAGGHLDEDDALYSVEEEEEEEDDDADSDRDSCDYSDDEEDDSPLDSQDEEEVSFSVNDEDDEERVDKAVHKVNESAYTPSSKYAHKRPRLLSSPAHLRVSSALSHV